MALKEARCNKKHLEDAAEETYESDKLGELAAGPLTDTTVVFGCH